MSANMIMPRNFFRRLKPAIKLASKLTSETPHLIKSPKPKFASAGFFICNGLPKNLLRGEVKAPLKFSSRTHLNHQHVRAFRRSKAREPVKPEDWLTPRADKKIFSGKSSGMSGNWSEFYKPLGFTAFVGATSFVGCTVWKYEGYRSTLTRDRWSLPGSWRIPGQQQTKVGSYRDKINSWWSQIGDGEKVFWVICGINVGVWLAWRLGSSPAMVNYFTASPNSRAVCWPMLLSTFSHYSLYHLAINMFVLHSFMPAAVNALGKEEFTSLYLTAGVVSSLGSHLQKLIMCSNVPSLGASGAIMAVLALVCTRFPDIQLGIIFIPGLTFSADTALKCVIAVDAVGLLAGWRFIDHAAHLSGTLFGIAYSKYGYKLAPARDYVLQAWHEFRNRTSS